MTHKSYSEDKKDSEDYEKLEFLGDSILNFLIARYFYFSTKNDE